MHGLETDACAARLPARAGVGLKPRHLDALLDVGAGPAFVEVHAENYMGAGGAPHHGLRRVRERHALSVHGVGLSIGGADPLDDAHLERLRALLDCYEPQAFSEHLAWSRHGAHYLNDLLPLPYDEATLARVCEHVERVQARLGRRMLIENPATYVEFATSTMSEIDFLAELVRRTGCGLLLDVANVHVSCTNHGRDARAYLDAFPVAAVEEIHLAGSTRDRDAAGDALLIDDHASPVPEPVWSLYGDVVRRLGPMPTLIEWDNDVPPLATLMGEAARADAIIGELARA
ncbi:MAG: DUF692 domain-containing protein [Gammaproteobacteria bacterium]|nr:DUF692 domain-containing protein [Gammaproteobacteria bacterium]